MDARWLLVYDNADDVSPGELSPYLPSSEKEHHILITTRNTGFRRVARVLRPGKFDETEAKEFLQNRSGRQDEQGSGALAHAAAYVEETGAGFADYLAYFENQRQALWAESEPPEAYPQTVATTWALSLDQIEDQAAIQLLKLCSFLAAEDIPLSLLQEAAGHEDLAMPDALREALENPLALNKTIASLGRYSLLERTGDSLAMHRLVQAVMRDRLGDEQAAEWAVAAGARRCRSGLCRPAQRGT